ncbi:MAG: tetratricopeptide repeat protein [Microcoleaceae cyanobacterium]
MDTDPILTQNHLTLYQSHCLAARKLVHQEKWQDAVTEYRQACRYQSGEAQVYQEMGDALIQLGKWEEAVTAYQEAITLDKNLPEVYEKLGDTIQKQIEPDRKLLLETYTAKVQQEPDQLQNYYRALEIAPENVELHVSLGKALVRQGQLDQATIAYKKAQQLKPDREDITQYLEKIQHQSRTPSDNTALEINEAFSQKIKLDAAKQALDKTNQVLLESFLSTGSRLYFPLVNDPDVSIILILYNRAELTLSCLYSILRDNFKLLEVIIVDNCSSDSTRELLERIHGANIILNSENRHFLLACNQAAQAARGKFLLFLNNDAQLLGDSINSALRTIQASDQIGAVGGKLVLPDGSLQEAGSIIWQDGSCLGYGRGGSPFSPEYMFQRSVDYCSAAFLLTPRQLFQDLGGFDEAYQPAYYEETDYCIRLQKLGKKIIYDPNVTLLHYEFASSSNTGSSQHAIALMERNQKRLVEKHQAWFYQQYPPDLKHTLLARIHARETQKRLLLIDDRVPHPYLGSGYTRSHGILSSLAEQNYFITLYATDLSYQEEWPAIYQDIPTTIEVARGYGLFQLEEFLQDRKGYYDIIFVSRPHNMEHLNYIHSRGNLLEGVQIIYDAEALYVLREIRQAQLQGEVISPQDRQSRLEKELELARHCDQIICVSQQEQQQFMDYGYPDVAVLGHSLQAHPTSNSFEKRQHILFVGSVYELESPNADAILWFCQSIFPKVQSRLKAQFGQSIRLFVAGNQTVPELMQQVSDLQNPTIELLGRVENLTSLYNQCRLFVAPTRFAAGIPHKVHEAAAHGLPVVTTSLLANQLGWQQGVEILVADEAEQFASQCVELYTSQLVWRMLRENALQRIQQECSPESFSATLKDILEKLNSA